MVNIGILFFYFKLFATKLFHLCFYVVALTQDPFFCDFSRNSHLFLQLLAFTGFYFYSFLFSQVITFAGYYFHRFLLSQVLTFVCFHFCGFLLLRFLPFVAISFCDNLLFWVCFFKIEIGGSPFKYKSPPWTFPGRAICNFVLLFLLMNQPIYKNTLPILS